jgi:hypothetical protein
VWARDQRMSLAFGNQDEPDEKLPVIVATPDKVYMRYGSREISVGNIGGVELMEFDNTNATANFRGNLDFISGRLQFRYGSATRLGYIGQRPESGGTPQMEIRVEEGPVRVSGGYLDVFSIYDNSTSSSANVNVDSSGRLRRSSSASRYKIDQRESALSRDLFNVKVKDWIDRAAWEEKVALDAKPRPLTELDQERYNAIDLSRVTGVIAEDVEANGGKRFVIYGQDGQIEQVMYDRFNLARTQLLYEMIQELRMELGMQKDPIPSHSTEPMPTTLSNTAISTKTTNKGKK